VKARTCAGSYRSLSSGSRDHEQCASSGPAEVTVCSTEDWCVPESRIEAIGEAAHNVKDGRVRGGSRQLLPRTRGFLPFSCSFLLLCIRGTGAVNAQPRTRRGTEARGESHAGAAVPFCGVTASYAGRGRAAAAWVWP